MVTTAPSNDFTTVLALFMHKINYKFYVKCPLKFNVPLVKRTIGCICAENLVVMAPLG